MTIISEDAEDTYGSVADTPLPVAAKGQAVTDQALSILLDYFKAIVNSRLTTAWHSVAPGKQVVRSAFPHDPEREWFSTKSLPALYGYREGGQAGKRMADDWQTMPDQLVFLWIFPQQKASAAAFRRPIINGLSKVLDRAAMLLRDPAYVDPDDTDPKATTYPVEPEAIKVKVATAAVARAYTSADFDGARGDTTLSPPRGFEVALTGSPVAFVDGSTITVVGTNALDMDQTVVLEIDTAQIPYTLKAGVDFKTIATVDIEAQASGAGFIALGLGARAGYGSSVVDRANLVRMWGVKTAHPYDVTIRRPNQDAIIYPAIRWTFGIIEKLTRAPLAEGAVANDSADTGTEASVTFLRASDSTIFQTAELPHGTVDPPLDI
jgi:hypothetical protein